jgi:NADPH:quinone reductase-like Zn-dependent oxidoreductase
MNEFGPMDGVPASVCLKIHDRGPEDFTRTPLDELVERVAQGSLRVQIGRVFKLDDIVEARRWMGGNRAGGKIVLLT